MKVIELLDYLMTEDQLNRVVIEMPNGDRLATKDIKYGYDARGENVAVIRVGRKVK